MRFRLLYEGELAPRQKISLNDVHRVRQKLDPQLQALWKFEPLKDRSEEWRKGRFFEIRGSATFIPLVSKKLSLHCHLDIILLRRQSAGQLIGDGGDIDNRVKTLLDALSVPPHAQQQQFEQEDPNKQIHCLLQDDSLVTKLSVETDRLLRPAEHEFDLVALIEVWVRASQVTPANIGIIS